VGLLALTVQLATLACAPTAAPGPPARLTLSEVRQVTLPNGAHINAEVMIHPDDMARGMMFRDALPDGEGMLFIHPRPGRYGYWMYNVRIPLDIIWMDDERRIVEIAAETPPCLGEASQCPSYGGTMDSQFVLELGGGQAARHGLKPGDRIAF